MSEPTRISLAAWIPCGRRRPSSVRPSAAAGAWLMGNNKVAEAAPPAPEKAIQGIKDDIATVKGDHHG